MKTMTMSMTTSTTTKTKMLFFLPLLLLLLLLVLVSKTSALSSTNKFDDDDGDGGDKGFTWSLCSPEPAFQSGVYNVTLSPASPVAGRNATLVVEASTDAVPAPATTREGAGWASASVSYRGLPIYSLSRPLCDVAVADRGSEGGEGERGEGGSCPFTGSYVLRWEQEFPPLTPAARYHLRLRAQESQPDEEGMVGGGRSRNGKERNGGSVGVGAAGPEILCVDLAFDVVREAAK